MTLKKKISIFIIEDNRLLRDGITSMINEQPDLKVIAASNEREISLSKIFKLNPDVVLIDLGLSSQNSLEVVKSIKKKSSDIKIIVMDLLPIESDILDFVKAGASGFILKDAMVHEFLKTIRSVAGGETLLPPILVESLFSQIIDYGVKEHGATKLNQSVRMTKREHEVVELIAEGSANKEIAHKLHLSIYTVKSHVHNILEKMALSTRVQIAIHAHSGGDYTNTVPGTHDISKNNE